MLLGYISDLHCEFNDDMINIPDGIDILCLAGDIHVRPKMLKNYLLRLRANTNAKIIYVLGNHEYYGHEFPSIRKQYNNQVKKVPDAWMLEREELEINGVRFLGTTLWSDLSNPTHALTVGRSLNDFYKIIITKETKLGIKTSRFKPEDYTAEFNRNVKWLEKKLKTPYDGRTVVVTHHSPSPITCSPYYKTSPIRFGFNSDISDLIIDYGPYVWIYGHDHVSGSFELGQTKLVSCQPGYPQEHRLGAKVKTIEV